MAEKPRPRKRAVALKYDPPADQAPVVTAKGQGHLADRIVALAEKNDVPIRQDRALVQTLSLLDLDQQISPAAYLAVAEILAFLYRIERGKG